MRVLASVRTAPARACAGLSARLHAADPEAGMTSAEYAVGTVAACGFSGVLYKVLTSDTVLELVKGVVGRALSLPS